MQRSWVCYALFRKWIQPTGHLSFQLVSKGHAKPDPEKTGISPTGRCLMISNSTVARVGLAALWWVLFTAAAPAAAGPSVLLLWDERGPQTAALEKALTESGIRVTFSQTNETGYDGTNPSLAGIDVVVHLNGTTYGFEMTQAGQKALERFVRDGGGYIHHEWNAYQLSEGQMTWMRNLILFDRTSGYSGRIIIERLEGMASHPVVWEIPPKFEINGGCNIGKLHVFEEEPAQVLAVDQNGNDAIAVREFGLGRIVGFHHGGNWAHGADAILDKREARRLFIDAVLWAHGCSPTFAKGARKQVCDKIAAKRVEAPPQEPVKPK